MGQTRAGGEPLSSSPVDVNLGTDVITDVSHEVYGPVHQLFQQARVQYELYQYGAALDLYHQALELSHELDYQYGIAFAQHHRARIHGREARYDAALSEFLGVLDTLSGMTSGAAEKLRADTNFQVGKLYANIFDKSLEALPFLERALAYYQQFENSALTHGDVLNGLGNIHQQLGNLGDSLLAYEAAGDIYRSLMELNDQVIVLNNISGIQVYLGNYLKAKLALEQALLLLEDLPADGDYRVSVLNNLGWLYERQYRYDEALDFYHAAQTARGELGRGISLSRLLSNIAYVHTQKNELDIALDTYHEALALTEVAADNTAQIAERIEIFNGIGTVYFKQKHYEKVWVSYHQSLRLAIQIDQSLGQARTLTEFGQLFQHLQQPLVAIAFYKQALNDIEQVRANLRSLPLDIQKRYTETVAPSYRELAALLFEQERIFEAHQVLDLLKLQELEDYFQDVRTEQSDMTNKIPYLPPEQVILQQHQQLLLADRPETDPVLSLDDFLRQPAVAAAIASLKHPEDPKLQPQTLQQLQQKLQRLPHKSAVLYPLVLPDRLELLLIPPSGAPIHHTTAISKTTLTDQVTTLRHDLADPSSNVKAMAQTLYGSIIRPLKPELHRLGIENIIYIPDGVLHYIPLSALYDAEQGQWLAEQYTSHNLTASDIGDLTQPPSRPFHVLAGAFADADQTFEALIDQATTNFQGLTYAGQEVAFLQEMLPTTEVLLDGDFSRDNLKSQLQGQNIVHLATHAAFVPGQPEDSFILLGNGDLITLKELRQWSLPNVDLVVLSACQTGISHIEDGLEILGMGFQVQRTDARAALASLWWVDDRSTSELMQLFYTELASGATKVEALQTAQLQLMAKGKTEPFYWAPFVLIGNGQ
ncbi:CHAT domain-containing protein [Leptothoe sp. PORK10 BA2]|uniref:CHAT domain-containing protein n=1 Tax=Leptothoe sp. PORK10 BA2 TaxID=3110254 RepID=UPI002B2205EF|nr:CHAT domain-containing protein [Leptothoe sp. PORK10 BA2]MEA5463420.1 CHAT domain-containing protein [Leptothoe sp. PORK10 BA2]